MESLSLPVSIWEEVQDKRRTSCEKQHSHKSGRRSPNGLIKVTKFPSPYPTDGGSRFCRAEKPSLTDAKICLVSSALEAVRILRLQRQHQHDRPECRGDLHFQPAQKHKDILLMLGQFHPETRNFISLEEAPTDFYPGGALSTSA